jgi:hypothetical protein
MDEAEGLKYCRVEKINLRREVECITTVERCNARDYGRLYLIIYIDHIHILSK